MPSTTLVSAAEIDRHALVDVFNAAYSDYMVPLQLNEPALEHTVIQNAIDLSISPVAMAGKKPVGMAFLARRDRRGWVGGMGVRPSHRRKGVGRQVMAHLLATAGQQQFDTVQLEVIERNTPAYKLYESLGFEVARRLLIVHCHISPEFEDESIVVRPVKLDEALDYYHQFHTSMNPWQRELDSLRHVTDLDAWVAWQDETPLGYVVGKITDPMIHIADIAGESEDALWALIAHIFAQAPAEIPASMVNIGEDDPAWPILNDMGFEESFAQLEMVYAVPS